MVYSTELANKIETSDNVNSKYLEAGIHEDVKFASTRVDKSINGNNFIEFVFEKDGKTVSHTEWETTKRPNESDEDCQTRGSKQVKRIMQILSCFYPKEALMFSGATFMDFANWVASMLNAANKENLLRLKVVYNNKGYTTLPNYCKFTFIEPMNLPEGEESKIKIIERFDVMTRPVIADTEKVEVNPLAAMPSTTSTDDDLPF